MNRLQIELDVDGIERLCDRATSGNVSHIVGTIKSYCRMIKEELDTPDWTYYKAQASIAAMQSIISNDNLFCRIEEAVNYEGVYDAIASDAVKMGNALIEEIKRTERRTV